TRERDRDRPDAEQDLGRPQPAVLERARAAPYPGVLQRKDDQRLEDERKPDGRARREPASPRPQRAARAVEGAAQQPPLLGEPPPGRGAARGGGARRPSPGAAQAAPGV